MCVWEGVDVYKARYDVSVCMLAPLLSPAVVYEVGSLNNFVRADKTHCVRLDLG